MIEQSPEFSVLLPVYRGDRPEFFERSLRSVAVDQALKPQEIVIVCDGPVHRDVELTLESLENGGRKDLVGSIPIQVGRIEVNSGLANALNLGLELCRYDVVARADADDISLPDRFLVQMGMVGDGNDLVGSAIQEFEADEFQPGMIRRMPETAEQIRRIVTYRDPFNHPSVIYRKSVVKKFGGYQHLERMEDYLLFARLVTSGVRCANSNEVLVKYRVGSGAYHRRGGSEMLKSEWDLQKQFLEDGIVTFPQFIRNVIVRGLYRLIPSDIRKTIYRATVEKIWNTKK